MENHKVISWENNKKFIVTNSFLKLYRKFQSLKTSSGRIILITGALGTGKSSNIYYALNNIDLNVYEPILLMDSVEKSSQEVFEEIINTVKEDLDVETEEEIYKSLSKFDTVLLSDKLADSEFIDETKVGLSRWVAYKSIMSFPFFFLWILEYLKYKEDLKKVNIIIQAAWTIEIKGFRYDLITDFGPLSKLITGILKMLFEVVEIDYSKSETIKIVKSHFKNVDEELIKLYMKKYGNKPRFILNDLEK